MEELIVQIKDVVSDFVHMAIVDHDTREWPVKLRGMEDSILESIDYLYTERFNDN